MTQSYQDLIDTYLAEPGSTTLQPLRDAVRAASNFDRAEGVDDEARGRIATQDWSGAWTALAARMPGALLSPSAHAQLALVLRRLGQEQDAEREEQLAKASLRSILSTGDGTAEAPWSVLRVSDEYDVINALKRRPAGQMLVRGSGGFVDRITCDDDSTFYFKATPLMGVGQ